MAYFSILNVIYILDKCTTRVLSLPVSLDKRAIHDLSEKLNDFWIDWSAACHHPLDPPSE
jgi:hypothetical protein